MGRHSAVEPETTIDKFFREAQERDTRRSPFPYCVVVEDGLDGFSVHHTDCRYVGQAWTSSSDCIGGGRNRYTGLTQDWMHRVTRAAPKPPHGAVVTKDGFYWTRDAAAEIWRARMDQDGRVCTFTKDGSRRADELVAKWLDQEDGRRA